MRWTILLAVVAGVVYGQSGVGGSGWDGFRIAQESKPGAGDFDDHILGFVTPVTATDQTISKYYGYGSASFLGKGITPRENTTQMFLVFNKFGTGTALFFYTVFDKSRSCCGGQMYSRYTVTKGPSTLDTQFVDDSGTTKTKFEGWKGTAYWRWKTTSSTEKTMQGKNYWVACCSDGNVFGPLTGATQIIADLHRPAGVKTPGDWWFLSFETASTGSPVHLEYEKYRRIRLDNHACSRAVDCHGKGDCTPKGKCTCDAGYAGDFCDKCATDYAGYPTCKSSVCLGSALPTVTDGKYSCGDTKDGGTCTLTCDGDMVASKASALCSKGTWESIGECHRSKADDCLGKPSVTIKYGHFDVCTDVFAGENCTLHCDDGYHKTGDATCVDKKWTAVGTCEPDACTTEPKVANGTFGTCAGTKGDKSTCTLTCDAGYTKSGDVVCSAGEWLHPLPTCIHLCSSAPPTIDNATWATGCAGKKHLETCAVTCAAGFTLADPSAKVATCEYGAWEVESECLSDSDCHGLPDLPDKATSIDCGVATGVTTIPDGTNCTLRCEPGYVPSAPFHCKTGKWDEEVCELNDPPDLMVSGESKLLSDGSVALPMMMVKDDNELPMTVTIVSPPNGTISLPGYMDKPGSSIVLTGTPAEINAKLKAGVLFHPDDGSFKPATISATASDGYLVDEEDITVDVTPPLVCRCQRSAADIPDDPTGPKCKTASGELLSSFVTDHETMVAAGAPAKCKCTDYPGTHWDPDKEFGPGMWMARGDSLVGMGGKWVCSPLVAPKKS